MTRKNIFEEDTFKRIVRKSLSECDKQPPVSLGNLTPEQLAKIVGSDRPNASKP